MKRLATLAIAVAAGASSTALIFSSSTASPAPAVSAPMRTVLLPPIPAPPVTPTVPPATVTPATGARSGPVLANGSANGAATETPAPAPVVAPTAGPDAAALPPAPAPYCYITATIPVGVQNPDMPPGDVTAAPMPFAGTFPCSDGTSDVPSGAVNIVSAPYTPGAVINTTPAS